MRVELPMQGRWEITRPIKGRADVVTIMELLSKISDGEIKAFIDENPKDLKTYGLNPPKVQLNFWASGEKENKAGTVLLLGDKDIKKEGYMQSVRMLPMYFSLKKMYGILCRGM